MPVAFSNERNELFDDEFYSTVEDAADAQSGDYEHVYEEPPSVYDHVMHNCLELVDDDNVHSVIEQPSAVPADEAIPDYLEVLEDEVWTSSADA